MTSQDLDLGTLHLDHGSHRRRVDGVCFNEAVAWFAGKDHTDRSPCMSPVLAAFSMNLNDSWDDEQRQKLIPFIPRCPGTAGDGHDLTRSYLALDWLIRTNLVAWLDLAGLAGEATALQELEPILNMEAAEAAGPVVRRAAWAAEAARAALQPTVERLQASALELFGRMIAGEMP